MAKRYFCTLFNSNYLLKGLAMVRSLGRFCPNAEIYVLCMDKQTKDILDSLNLPFINTVLLAEIEDSKLLKVKAERSVTEYCWTLSSCFTWYVMQSYQEIDLLTYVDADLFFYSEVQPIFNEIDDASIAIIEHRFTPRLKHLEVNGRFCVEWNSFRRDHQGLSCLSRWRDQCIEWCYYRPDKGKMGDQKYLDKWPEYYSSCHIIMHPGAGIAPWNYAQYRFSKDRKGNIAVEGSPLIFYHFHQFQLLTSGKFDRLSSNYTVECPEPDSVYKIYEDELKKCLGDVRAVAPAFTAGIKPFSQVFVRRLVQKFMPIPVKKVMSKYLKR